MNFIKIKKMLTIISYFRQVVEVIDSKLLWRKKINYNFYCNELLCNDFPENLFQFIRTYLCVIILGIPIKIGHDMPLIYFK